LLGSQSSSQSLENVPLMHSKPTLQLLLAVHDPPCPLVPTPPQ
jgi:hypothetical protein